MIARAFARCSPAAAASGGLGGEGEAGVAEAGVRFVEAEAAAGGEGEGFVEVAAGGGEVARVGVEGGAGEEAEGDVVLSASAAEAVDGLGEMGGGLGEVAGRAALDGEEVFEGDEEERVPRRGPSQTGSR